MEEWVLASGNPHKIEEFNRFFERENLGIRLISMKDAGFTGEIDESGLSFAENAFRKADAVRAATGRTVLADDSGLCVDALGGRPGIYSARYAGGHGNDGENNKKLLSELEGLPEEERTARFCCALC
ncbi:MAG: non-canonical purine NTP pyrophosphatase, partial [Clostridia bacterium]|nr:non-canonical purine NTP pyrophosphatase [Clostridia bacterium]